MRPFKFCFTNLNRFVIFRVQNLSLEVIKNNRETSSHNSLQYSVKSQHFLRVLNSFSLHLKQRKAVFKISATHKQIS